jgi:manganese efflux pump family protein
MAVGASLAFINVAIVPVAIAIGLATFTMVTFGVMLGRVLVQHPVNIFKY